jgi:hypothetical protein
MSTQPTDKDVVDFLATAAHDYASGILVGTSKPLMPAICIVRAQEPKDCLPVEVIGCPWSNDAQKKTMVMKVGKKIASEGARAWSFLSEAWTAKATPEEHKEHKVHVRPMDRPDRNETVFCLIGLGSEHPVKLWSWDIVREAGEKSKCLKLSSGACGEPGIESWIAQLLNAAMDFHRLTPEEIARYLVEGLQP